MSHVKRITLRKEHQNVLRFHSNYFTVEEDLSRSDMFIKVGRKEIFQQTWIKGCKHFRNTTITTQECAYYHILWWSVFFLTVV